MEPTSGVSPLERGLIRLTGEQRIWFLQNTISADVEGVPAGRWVESCFLGLKGHVVAHFRVGVLPDEVLIDADAPFEPLLDWFVRYRFRTKVEIEQVDLPCHAVFGDLVPDGTVRGTSFGLRFGDVRLAHVFGETPAGPAADPSVYEVARIEAGIGAFGVDYGPQTLPQEAGLTRIVSVTKGCYVGQEVMARLHFRGHVNRTLRPLTFEAPARAGAVLIKDGTTVGTVSSVAVSPTRGPIGIGMVRVEVEAGEQVECDGGAAVVGPLPPGTKTV